ncbi:hypothetical protein DRO60_00450, partial [Candidatus Bathyarchaeota archaeon]
MIVARYRGAGIDLATFQATARQYLEQAGWEVKKVVQGARSFEIQAKKGFMGKVRVVVRGVPEDVYVEVVGSDEADVMDLVERAAADSASNPAAVENWRLQLQERAARAAAQVLSVLSRAPFPFAATAPT